MRHTLRWQLYVIACTFLLGLPLLMAHEPIVPLLGFQPTREPWVRPVGMFLLALSGDPPFLYVMSGIVMIGVLGSSISCLVERRTHVYATR